MKPHLFLLLLSFSGVFCYLSKAKETLLSGILLRGLVDRINGKQDGDISYLDLTDGPSLDIRALTRGLEEEQMFPLDYDNLGVINIYPAIRDREYMQHSNLWGNQYISGGSGDGNQMLGPGLKIIKQKIKTDASLPAYCNPPNPCPIDYAVLNSLPATSSIVNEIIIDHVAEESAMEYINKPSAHSVDEVNNTSIILQKTRGEIEKVDKKAEPRILEDQGCLEDFDNSASFSRSYQALQDCMCDTEHMFDCPSANNPLAQNPIDVASVDFSRLLQQSLKTVRNNPFLTGAKLPVAAKKGSNMY